MAGDYRQRPLHATGHACNRALAALRRPIERTFAILKRWYGYGRVRYRSVVQNGRACRPWSTPAWQAFGRIDVLVNNVGIARVGGIVSTEEADWDLVTEVNQKSMYLVCRQVAPIMERQGSGAIVNIASVAAHRWTGISYASYYATKGAVVALSRAIALEFAGKGIRCNSVSPGLMDTPMVRYGLTGAYGKDGDVDNLIGIRTSQCPMGHMGTGWDTAHAVLFLASDEAKYITGIDLIVDGGLTAKFA